MSSTYHRRPRVVCFSHDRVLGKTRFSVLQRQYDAVFVGSLEEFRTLVSGPSFDAVVLCHTLPLEECRSCLEIARYVWPSAKIIAMTSGTGNGQLDFDAKVLGLDGPLVLLDTVQRVLQPSLPAGSPS